MKGNSIASRLQRSHIRVNYNETNLWKQALRSTSESAHLPRRSHFSSSDASSSDSSSSSDNQEEVSFMHRSHRKPKPVHRFADLPIRRRPRRPPPQRYRPPPVSESSSEPEDESDPPLVIQQILGERDSDSDSESKSYYVKFVDQSHIHNQWMKQPAILELTGGDSAVRRYQNRLERDGLSHSLSIPSLLTVDDSQVNSFWFEVDRVIDEIGDETKRRYFVKWKLLGYDESTWEKPEDVPATAIQLFRERLDRSNPTKIPTRWRRPKAETFVREQIPIQSKSGDTLRSYQMEGYNWLRYCWYNERNSILADEMGLGKTAQVVTVLGSLSKQEEVSGPFLVVAPLSTLEHWKSEFERWSDLNAFIYHGNQKARNIIKETEFVAVDGTGDVLTSRVQFDVLITNYETVLQDFPVFSGIEWRYLVVDEAHKLKNAKGKLYKKMETIVFQHCTMLTGTPIQNCIEELWGLLHFLYPKQFSNLDEFTDRYGNTSDCEQVLEIQKIIQPIMLRRKKSDVEKSILPKEETIVEVELTRPQKTFYRAFLHENAGTLLQTITGGALPSLLNLMMQLRKVCNHPYLIKGAEAEIVREKRTELPSTLTPSEIEHRALVDASGKMIFIDKLLPKLREGHHKVLIFSQMVRVLTIIEEYLVRQAYPFVRIDGSVAENERQTAIEHFNVDDNAFIFLLSTRAGGVGINLTAADTVIIYDSDWNPQNDIQAQARCHRIGQKATVKVYRLITRGTYEQKMFERASRKLGLDHVVLDGGEMSRDARPMKAAEIEEMLRNGVHGIFNEDDTEADRFCAADIDQILSRRAKVYTSDVISGGGSIFAKATFNADADGPDLNAADFWTQVIPASHGFHEQATIRRCRQHKLEMAVTTDIDGAQSSRKIAQRIIERGFRATPGEIQIVRYAMKFCNIADPQLTPLVTQIVGTEDPEAANQAFVTVIGAEAAWAIEDRSPKIIEQILFFARLRRALSFVQRVNIQWPVIPPFWEDPVSEYALAVAVDRYGWRELPAGIGAPELGLKQTKPLGKGQIRVRLTQLIEQLEVQMPEALLAPPDSFEPPLPKAWRDSHPGVLARTVVVDQEIVAVFNALRAFGKPTEDWEELRELARLDLMSASTVKSIGEALIHAAEAPTEDFAQFPLLEPAREFLSPPDLHRLSVSLREMSEIRDFAAKINPRRTEVLKEIRQPTQGPSWWTWECDRALILSVARHGRFKVATWMVDRTLPFRGHFPKAFIEQLERAAEQEETRGKKVRLQGAEDCGFLLREKTRIARCLTVINAVNKVIRQDSENRPSKRPEFPMNVASGVTLVSPGRFVLGNPRYDCKMTPFPVGFCLERKYRIREWPSRLSFRSEIREGKDGPEFVVTCLSEPVESFVGVDSSEAWNQAIETVSKRFAKQGVEGEVVEEEVEVEEEESKHRVIGNVLFGLYNKKVVGELIKLENAGVMKGLQRALADVKPICRAFEIQLPTYVEVNPE